MLTLLGAIVACSKDSVQNPEKEIIVELPKDTTKVESALMLGVNGHPLNQEAYLALTPAKQIELIANLGMKIYRIDVTVDPSTGYMKMHDNFLELYRLADSAGIILLPMLPIDDLTFEETEQEARESGYRRGINFATTYKDYFDYYNVGNELDIDCILPDSVGTSEEHYDAKKFAVIAANLRGIIEGIRAVDNAAKTMVNTTWLHYGYLFMLENYGVEFDIIAYHWYDDMEETAAKHYDIPDITKLLTEMFTKQIWFTEFNIRNADGKESDLKQRDFLNTFIQKCRNNPGVAAAVIYELLDQPVFNNIESHYGLYRWSMLGNSVEPKLWALEHAILR